MDNDHLLIPEQFPTPSKASLSELFVFASKLDLIILSLSLISLTIFTCLPIFLIIKLGEIIDNISDIQDNKQIFYEKERESAIIMIVAGIITTLFGWAASYGFLLFASRQALAFKSNYFKSIINKPVKWFDKNNPAELASFIDIQCENIENCLSTKFIIGYSSLVFFIASWIASFCISLELTMVSLCVVPLQIIPVLFFQKASENTAKLTQERQKIASGIAEECLEGVKTVASCNAQEKLARNYQNELKVLNKEKIVAGFWQALGAGIFLVAIIGFTGVLCVIAAYFMVDRPEILGYKTNSSARDVVIIFFLTSLTTANLGITLPCIIYIQQGLISAKAILTLIKSSKKFDGLISPESILGYVCFENVHFAYPSNKSIKVLKGITFEINPGQSLMIVGETGCGKSTILQLISGFYYANEGVARIDKVDIKDYNLGELRRFIAFVGQEPILFSSSIRENILVGREEATKDEVELAAKNAEAEEFILSLPEKYETFVGIKGCQLSGGQKQRIAIARAIIKRPRILLLDEATSALDVKTELKIRNALDDLMAGKTVIKTTQRISSIKSTDMVMVISEGNIIEQGTYEGLCNSEGYFTNLLALQTHKKLLTDAKEVNHFDKDLQIARGTSYQTLSTQQTLKRIMSLVKAYWGYLLIISISSALTGLTYPCFGYYFSLDIHALLLYDSAEAETKRNMYILLICAAVAMISLTVLGLALSKLSAKYSHKLRYKVMQALLYKDLEFYDEPRTSPAYLAYRLSSDCEKISRIGGIVLGIQLIALAALISGFVVSMMYSVKLSLVAAACVPFIVYTNVMEGTHEKKGLTPKNLEITTEIASDSLTNIKTVHSFNLQDQFHTKYMQAHAAESASSTSSLHFNAILFGSRYSILYISRGITTWYGAYLIKTGEITNQDFLIVSFCLNFSTWCFAVVGILASEINEGIASAQEIFRIFDFQPKINASSESGVLSSISGEVEFKRVHFHYSSRDVPVLNDLSFKIKAGGKLGITGRTGSGKSTIAQLLLRFYDVTQGEILIDGVNLKDFNTRYLRNCICWVGQEPILFKGSIINNLRLGSTQASLEEVFNALNKAQALDIIELYGLESDVGLKGCQLSGGQKQRIAIARALIRNPQIIILDEATSALDTKTETNLLACVYQEKSTIISIAHRIKSIQNSDLILVIEKGSIVEAGSHSELLSIHNGHYKDLLSSS